MLVFASDPDFVCVFFVYTCVCVCVCVFVWVSDMTALLSSTVSTRCTRPWYFLEEPENLTGFPDRIDT